MFLSTVLLTAAIATTGTACSTSRVPAAIVNPVLPEVPQQVLDTALKSATVLLTVSLDARGRLASATVSQSSGSAPFDALAQSLAWHSKFQPEVRNCEPVHSSDQLQIDFTLTPYDPKNFRGGADLQTHAHLRGVTCVADHGVVLVQNPVQRPANLHIPRSVLKSRSSVVLVDVDASGSVTGASIATSTGSDQLDAEALRSARSATYAPAVSGCQALPGTFRYVATFSRNT